MHWSTGKESIYKHIEIIAYMEMENHDNNKTYSFLASITKAICSSTCFQEPM